MARFTIALPALAPGTQHTLIIHRYGQPGARPKAYFQAALHADETPALLVAHRLLRLLEHAADHVLGEVVIVPVANPIGLSQQLNGCLLGRFDFGATGNFNRQFPALPDAALLAELRGTLDDDAVANIERVRAALRRAVAAQPQIKAVDALKLTLLGLSIDADYVFDLHCDTEALLHLYAPTLHRETTRMLGADLGVAVMLLEQDSGGMAFDEANSAPWWKLREQLGVADTLPPACFATTVELRGQADVDAELAERDAGNLYRFLQRQGVLAGTPGPMPVPLCEPTPLTGVDVPVTPSAGVLVYRKQLGDRVQRDEVVAEVVDPMADPAAAPVAIRSRGDGILFTRLAARLVQPGQPVAKIAGAESLAHRQSGKLLLD